MLRYRAENFETDLFDMERQEYDLLLGRLAIHFKVLTKEQFGAALQRRRLADEAMELGQFLVGEHYLAPDVLAKLEKARSQYLEKNGLTPPDPGDQTKPVSPVAAEPPASSPEPGTVQQKNAATQPLAAQQPQAAQLASAESAMEQTVAVGSVVAPQPAAAAPALPSPSPAPPAGDTLLSFDENTTLSQLMEQTRQINASDLHLHSLAPIRVRLNGEMRDATSVVDAERSKQLIFEILSEEQQKVILDRLQLDFSFELPGIGRFRANAYKQQRGWDAVFRVIPASPPSLQELGLPEDLERVVSYHQGLVLFTGPAGCGKSSTMAAMVDLLNRKRLDHIITVEDPIEVIHPSKQCLVNQRHAGRHTQSFTRALQGALREDPDIIVIGELRDLETIELALTAAETGHLVLGTLHTSNAIRTINRLLGVFPPEQQNQIRTMVSESLRAVVSQRLVAKADDSGRVAAIEVLMTTKAIGNLIREKKTFQILSQMQTGSRYGMVILDNSLAEFVKKDVITVEQARLNAEDPKRFA